MAAPPPWVPPGPPQPGMPGVGMTASQQPHPNLGYDNNNYGSETNRNGKYVSDNNYPDFYEPRDPSTTSDVRHPPPLKRGDACLYCRRRRIRCSATKPQCHHCAKLKRECVYDVGKPVSRVRKLENKVAELEGYLRQANASAAAPPVPRSASLASSGSSGSLPPTIVHGQPQPPMVPIPSAPHVQPNLASHTSYSYAVGSIDQSTVDITMMDNFQPAPGMRGMAGRLGVTVPTLPNNGHDMGHHHQPPPGYDWDTLDPSYMNLVSQFSETTPPSREQGGPPGATQHDGHRSHLPHAQQQQQPTMRSHAQPHHPQPTPGPPQGTQPSTPYRSQHQINENPSEHHFIAHVPQITEPHNPVTMSAPRIKNVFHNGDINIAYVTTTGEKDSTLVGGWYDPNNLPKAARDELLGKFFATMRSFARGFNVPRFMASLAMPIAKRPHPCLLYSMYAIVARYSPSPKLRKLEDHFCEIASAQLQQAVKTVDRLFDAIRASTIMAVYYYSKAQYHVGAMLMSQASRLAQNCGLHQITSSVWKPTPTPTDAATLRLLGMMRRRGFLIPPAQDAIEHGERIWAFWNVYLLDRTGSIAAQWPPNIHDGDVCTPFPKPLYEYELGLVSKKDDYSLPSLYEEGVPQILPYNTESSADILSIKCVALLEETSKLVYRPSEKQCSGSWNSNGNSNGPPSPPDIDDYLRLQSYYAANPDPAQEMGNTSRTPRLRTPLAFERYRTALLRLENSLPPHRRAAWGVWDGNGPEWVFQPSSKLDNTVHFMIGCAWMFLYDTCSFQAPNAEAVACARRMAFTMRAMLPDRLLLDFEAFMAMLFSFVSMVLIREVKRLQALGDHVTAASIHEDFEIVLAAIKAESESHVIGRDQAARAEDSHDTKLEETFMRHYERENDVDQSPPSGGLA